MAPRARTACRPAARHWHSTGATLLGGILISDAELAIGANSTTMSRVLHLVLPPPKVLVSHLKKTSIQDKGLMELSEMWARLLRWKTAHQWKTYRLSNARFAGHRCGPQLVESLATLRPRLTRC